ncbi:hypothetical protein L3Y34_009820 [Caenorhabditis briggsae]|uniref:Uncharacterized protein n=1 Tax=Caenorhabditis briggsae TaxID=6238 RepID=A0AAE9A3J1_CAEBR|nr:hypothetical protein L3Y34_009820 [Caenorhabditis briggsae]
MLSRLGASITLQILLRTYHIRENRLSNDIGLISKSHTPVTTFPSEFVGNYGPFHHMTPYCLKMPWFQRYGYDVLLFKIGSFLAPVRSEEMKLDPVTMDNVTSSFWNINVNSKEGHSLFDPVHKLTVQSCRSLFSNSELLATLRSHEYDVGISEPMMTCSLALFRHLGIQKTILASSCPNFDVVMAAMGEPAETSYVPAPLGVIYLVKVFYRRNDPISILSTDFVIYFTLLVTVNSILHPIFCVFMSSQYRNTIRTMCGVTKKAKTPVKNKTSAVSVQGIQMT